MRLFAADECFRQRVDTYILDNIAEVTNTKHFFTLPRVAVEIVGKGIDSVGLIIIFCNTKIDG